MLAGRAGRAGGGATSAKGNRPRALTSPAAELALLASCMRIRHRALAAGSLGMSLTAGYLSSR